MAMKQEGIDCPEILHTWFGEGDDAAIIGRQSKLWWGKDVDVDADLRRRFEPVLKALSAGGKRAWLARPEGRLAAIILADQIPRNIYRETPAAFSTDPLARSLTLEGLEAGADRMLRPLQRVFFYLPLEHAESLALQDLSVMLFQVLLDEAPPALQGAFRGYLDFARRHRDIIRRFGRFPHRNRILGRESGAAELVFLEQPGSGF